jgi:ElaB/YqjD/DUF883 family membrane-anchored ribosome-binding protein
MTNIESKKKSLEEQDQGVRATVADTLESAADSVRSAANDSIHKINDLANDAEMKLDSTASCVRTWAGGKLVGNLRSKIHRNPVGSLAVAAAIGLLAGVSWKTSR